MWVKRATYDALKQKLKEYASIIRALQLENRALKKQLDRSK